MKTIHESVSTPRPTATACPASSSRRPASGWRGPHRTDTWAWGAKPAQKQYADVARAIAEFEPVTMCVNQVDYANARAVFEDDENVTVVEMTTDDAWVRDTGATGWSTTRATSAPCIGTSRLRRLRERPVLPVGPGRARGSEGGRPRRR